MTDQRESSEPETKPSEDLDLSVEQELMDAALDEARQRVKRLVMQAREAERIPAELLNARMRARNGT
jgi:hypothetical protein